MATKNPMQSGRSFFVSFMGRFCCVKKTEIIISIIAPNVSLPAIASRMPRNTFKARFICNRFFNIFHVFKSVCNTQVFQPIVRWISVYMVNFTFRPFVMGHCPCGPVSAQKHIVHPNNNVSRTVKTCDNLSGSTLSSFYAPTQVSCVGVVRKKIFKAGDFWMFHNGNMATLEPVVNGGKF